MKKDKLLWMLFDLALLAFFARLGASALLHFRQQVCFPLIWAIILWLCLLLLVFVFGRRLKRPDLAGINTRWVMLSIAGFLGLAVIVSAVSLKLFLNTDYLNTELARNALRELAGYETEYKKQTSIYTESLDELGALLFGNKDIIRNKLQKVWKGKKIDDVLLIQKYGDEFIIMAVPPGFKYTKDQIVYDSSEPRLISLPRGFSVTWSFDPCENSEKMAYAWSYRVTNDGSVFDEELSSVRTALLSYGMEYAAAYDDAKLNREKAMEIMPLSTALFIMRLEDVYEKLLSRNVPQYISAKEVWELYEKIQINGFTSLPKAIIPEGFDKYGKENIYIKVYMDGKTYESRLYAGDKILDDSRGRRFLRIEEWLMKNVGNGV